MSYNSKSKLNQSEVKMPSNSKSNDADTDDLLKLVDLYYKQPNILYSHQHNSYNQFIEKYVYSVLKKNENVFFEKLTKKYKYRYKFKFDNIFLKPPTLDNEDELMFPSDALTRSLTYASKLVATVTQIQERIDLSTDEKTERIVGEKEHEVPITMLPIMVRSKFCSLNIKPNVDNDSCDYDPGGYFIVNGSEKVVLSLEKMIDNKPLTFIKKDQNNKIYTTQIISKNYETEYGQIFTIRMKKDGIITLKIHQFNELSVFILIRALGIQTDKDIINYVVNDSMDVDMINHIRISLDNTVSENGVKIITQEEAIDYLIQKMKIVRRYTTTDVSIMNQEKRMHLMNILTNDILPHMGKNMMKKAYFICGMVNQLLKCYSGKTNPADRDSFVNKRIEVPGVLIGQLFKQYFKKMLNDCNKFFKKKNNDDENPMNIINQIKPNIIGQNIKSSLLTGSWGGSKSKKGVAQVLSRLTFLQTIAYLRRVNSTVGDASTNKLTHPRHLHSSQYGYLCPVETPEGAKVGLVKSLSLIGNVSLHLDSQVYLIKGLLKNSLLDLEELHPFDFKKYFKVFLNGEWLGMAKEPVKIVNKFRKMRRHGTLEKTVSVVFNIGEKEIRIYCDGGRLYRPLLRVEDNKLLLKNDHVKNVEIKTNDPKKIYKWTDFLTKHPDLIEYVDVEESTGLLVAMYPKDVKKEYDVMNGNTGDVDTIINRYDNNKFVRYTHCEFHPFLALGLVASTIPYCNHNQAPRNIFQYSQAKQAMGIYISNYRKRLDLSHVLYHSQTPLITTRTAKYMHTDKLAAGENVIVAILSYTGYNQEDSIIMNQSAIDRGLFRSTSYKKETETIAKNPSTSQDDVFVKPDKSKVTGMRNGVYDKLNEKGYVPEETVVNNGDFIIGKITPIQPQEGSNKVYKDTSKAYKANVSGVIDKVWTGIYNNDGYEMYKMRIRSERIPKIGDKFSSRHG